MLSGDPLEADAAVSSNNEVEKEERAPFPLPDFVQYGLGCFEGLMDLYPYLDKNSVHNDDDCESKSSQKKLRCAHSFKVSSRPLQDSKIVFEQNAWDDIEWEEEQVDEAAHKVKANSRDLVDEVQKLNLEKDASSHWSNFYQIHQNKFFKNRKWLLTEFPDLCNQIPPPDSPDEDLVKIDINVKIKEKREEEVSKSMYIGECSNFRILEVGCGNGSTVFPLLVQNNSPETYIYCCDFSTEAVKIVTENLDSNNKLRCTPFVWDATSENSDGVPFPPASLDIIIVIFVLSAISPEKFDQVIQNFYKFLKPGGLVLFRDYGLYDLVQLRFKPGKCISENFYFRGDKTRVYFFKEDEVKEIFERNNFSTKSIYVDRRLQVNRQKRLKMYRIWIQGKFQKNR